jgi:uncharacterized protein
LPLRLLNKTFIHDNDHEARPLMEIFEQQAPWFLAGPLVGLLVVAGYWALNAPLGGVGAWAAVADRVTAGAAGPSWRMFFFLGLVLGGTAFALASGALGAGQQQAQLQGLWGTPAALLVGGLLMGVGARSAGGCTLGHGMCGTSAGSPSSFAATATFMATAIGTAHLLVGVWG